MFITPRFSIPLVSVTLFLLCCGGAPAASAESRYAVSADGSEVMDQQTGLIWRRCAEGMNWSGNTCIGSLNTFTWALALQRASNQAQASGKSWRLPNMKELSSLVDLTQSNPNIDSTAFPNTPSEVFWSSSPVVGDAVKAWSVSFTYGNVFDGDRSNSYAVRLVRAGQ